MLESSENLRDTRIAGVRRYQDCFNIFGFGSRELCEYRRENATNIPVSDSGLPSALWPL